MKYCTNCGAQCEDNAVFCVKCGTKFEISDLSEQNETMPVSPPQIILSQTQPQYTQQPQQPQQYQQPPQYQPPPPQYAQPPYGGYAPPLPATPATGMLKKISSSPLFIVFLLLYSLLLVVRLIKVFTDAMPNVPSYFYGSQVNGVAIAVGLIVWILPALIGLGLWMHFMAANDKTNEGMKTSGLTVIKVCTIITLVLVSITLLVLFIVLFIALIAALASGLAAAGAGMALMWGIYLIFAVLAIIYYVKVLKSISAVSMCATTGNGWYKVSSYVPVIHFILAFFGIIGIIAQIAAYSWIRGISGDLLNQIYRQVGRELGSAIDQMIGIGGRIDIWAIAVTVLDAAASIAISVAMLSYNSKIKALIYSRTMPYQQSPLPYTQNTPPTGF